MKRNITNTKLSKDFILSKVSQINIISRYLQIPIDIIENCIVNGKLIQSVFREDDNNGSLGFTIIKNGKVKCKDFGGLFWGDCFDVVAYIISSIYNKNFNVCNKNDFYFILKHIAYTFKDIIYGDAIDDTNSDAINKALKTIKTKTIIEFVPRTYNVLDDKIMSKWGLTDRYLTDHYVYPVDQYYINRTVNPEPCYYYSSKDPCYAYVYGMDKHGIYLLELYFPLRNKRTNSKFITNANCLSGILNLDKNEYDYIIITKSSKDRLSIGKHLHDFPLRGIDVGVINYPSESYRLKSTEYNFLKSKLKKDGTLIAFMDFDYAGRVATKDLVERFKMPYIFITNGIFGLNNYEAKDFAELKEKYSNETINEFIYETLKLFIE